MINATFPLYVLQLGGSEMLVGVTAAGFSIAAVTLRPIAGRILDISSRRGILKWGLISLMAVNVIFLTVPILAIVVVVRIVSGFMFAGTGTATNTNAADAIPLSRFGEGIGFLGMGNTLATAIGPALGLMIIGNMGFPALFIVSIGVILIAKIMSLGVKFRTITPSVTPSKGEKKGLMSLFSKDAIPASVVTVFFAMPFGAVTAFIVLFGELYDIGSGGLFFALVAVGTGSTRIFSGRIADIKGEKPLVTIGCIGMATAMVLLVLGHSVSYYLAGLVYGISFGVTLPAMQAMAMRVVKPEERGRATATFLCSFDISSGMGGFIGGAVITMLGYRPMFAVMITSAAISLALYYFWARKTPSAFENATKNI
jgi:MFS family permease